MKYIKIAVPVILFITILTGCNYFFGEGTGTYSSPIPAGSPISDDGTVPSLPATEEPPADTYTNEIFTEISEYFADLEANTLPPGPNHQYIITAAWATPETMSVYEAFEEFYELEQGPERVIFAAGTALMDFRFIALGLNEAELYFYEKERLYSLEELLPERPFIANWQEIDHLPHRGIAFVDFHNQTRYFFITTDIESGEIILMEFWPGLSLVSG